MARDNETVGLETSFSADLADALGAGAVAPLQPGRCVADRYEVVRLLGSGAMGAVYEARHRTTGGRVALKVMSASSEEQRERFALEARHAAALNHPNTVTVIDYGIDHDRPYLVMEYLDGQPLSDLVNAGPLPWSRVRRIVAQVLEALVAAHEHPFCIVHRDIKPANIVDARWSIRNIDVSGTSALPWL